MRRLAVYSIFITLVVSPLLLIGCGNSESKNGTDGSGGGAGGTAKLDGGGTGDGTGGAKTDGGAGRTDGGAGNTGDGGEGTSVDAPTTSDTATALDSNALDGGSGTVPQQCLAGLVNPFAAMAPDWANWSSSSCSSLVAADGSLVLTQNEPCSAASPNAIAGLAPPNVLCGDFDVQVDFAVTGLVAGVTGGIFASMRANDPTVTTNGMTIERYAAEYVLPSSQSYQNYKSYTTNKGDDATSVFVPTTDVTGRFRLTRTGTTVKSYYWKTGAPAGQWVLVNTATLTNTPWVLVLYEGDNSAANKGPTAPYSVTFSNLLVTFPGATDAGTSNTGVDAAQADRPATDGTGGAGSTVDGAADWSGADAPATDGTQAADCLPACNANATCVSGDGGEATCACNPGYFGDGYGCTDVAVSLAGLRWELPCNDTTYEPTVCGCAASATDTKTIGGVSTAAYDVTLRFRGVVEENACTGGVRDGFWCVGGSMGGGWNTYKLTITHDGQKDQVFYLNAGSSGLYHSYAIDYQRTLRIYGGSIVRLDAQTGDSREIKNISADTNGQPFVIPGVAPAPLAFNGQFIQVDVVSIVQVSP